MGPQRVAIAGAGIAGLATALALCARGHAVTLVERRTALSEVGAGLQLSPNASRVLIALGLGPALRRAATEPPGVTIRALRSGRTIGAVALGASMRARAGAPYLVVRRADLQTILLDAVRARPGVQILVGRNVEAIDCRSEEAVLSLASGGGARPLAVDLAVAADGVHSGLRALLDPALARPTGFSAYRALVPRPAVPAELAGEATGLWLGPGRHVVHYPVAGGSEVNVVAVFRAPAFDWDAPGDPARLRDAFADATPPLAELLARPASWLARPLIDRPVARPMARGRLALVGDAAHPVLPYLAQGAALAIEDAAALAVALDRAATIPEALADYAGRRVARARRVRGAARRNGLVYHAGPLVALARDRVIARLGPEGMARRLDWLYGHAPDDGDRAGAAREAVEPVEPARDA